MPDEGVFSVQKHWYEKISELLHLQKLGMTIWILEKGPLGTKSFQGDFAFKDNRISCAEGLPCLCITIVRLEYRCYTYQKCSMIVE